jgi:cell wall-associated NlpC family hydrolase
MELSQEKREAVVAIALEYLDREWGDHFNCITFVREVYRKVCVDVPLIYSHVPPPKECNISADGLDCWHEGLILFLKRKGYTGSRTWTHVGITMPSGRLIHCSDYFGKRVSITQKEEIFTFYQYVPSR